MHRLSFVLVLVGCSSNTQDLGPGRAQDAQPQPDAVVTSDAGFMDVAFRPDTLAVPDAALDAGFLDAEPTDADPADADAVDGHISDTGPNDAGTNFCQTAADCTAGALPPFCAQPSASCIDGQCVTECLPQGRTCRWGPSSLCFNCGANPSCPMGPSSTCPYTTRHPTFVVEATTCGSFPDGTPLQNATINARSWNATCAANLLTPSGMEFGTLFVLDDRSFVANIPSFGGTCTGVDLPTGAVRHVFTCPDCYLVVVAQ